MKCCHKCGAPWESSLRQPAVKEICGACHAYLHCCKNCRHHRPGLPNQCHIPNTEAVADRAGCNFCDDFEFRDTPEAVAPEVGGSAAREAARALFGDGGGEAAGLRAAFLEEAPKRKDPRKGLDDLFGG